MQALHIDDNQTVAHLGNHFGKLASPALINMLVEPPQRWICSFGGVAGGFVRLWRQFLNCAKGVEPALLHHRLGPGGHPSASKGAEYSPLAIRGSSTMVMDGAAMISPTFPLSSERFCTLSAQKMPAKVPSKAAAASPAQNHRVTARGHRLSAQQGQGFLHLPASASTSNVTKSSMTAKLPKVLVSSSWLTTAER